MEERPKEIAKIVIRDCIEIDECIKEMNLKKKKLKKIIYQYIKINELKEEDLEEEEEFAIRFNKRSIKIMANGNERGI